MACHDVVVTGIGWQTALGDTVTEVWSKIGQGETGIDRIPLADPASGYGVNVWAPCAAQLQFQPTFRLAKKQLRSMSRTSQLFVAACLNTLVDAGLTPEQIQDTRMGVLMGTGGSLCDEFASTDLDARSPSWFLNTYPNLPAAYLSLVANITGYSTTIVNACVSSSMAIGQAFRLIRSGEEECLLAGGSDSRMTPSYLSGFSRLGMHTPSVEANTAMRPFDAQRNGFVIGEGAAALLLESERHAKARGANILGYVRGFGVSMDAYRLTDPHADGKAAAMARALRDGQVDAGTIDYINAHGTSTQANDLADLEAIRQLFTGTTPWVNSSKSLFGHTLAASGAIESIICLLSLQQGHIHANRNLDQPDNHADVRLVGSLPQNTSLRYSLNNSSAIGGCNTSLVFEKA
uniref:beta-ketoacyl-[acyl-carrier-protein] synthase family protein n=1 Tax=Thaumasiovibrio occultus TaxID=1891184 RepID=UPI000B35580B|nr:beta-ketoacyl-[acyl-carrier-protein] synthase family protein [Thaumasiovibrio occultus]